MKKVLTIIVSYNFEPWIHKCIPSLLHSSYPTDIIVIDNASKDNTVAILKEEYPTVLLIESDKNLGFGKANNIGVDYAVKHDYDYVYLVNQDAWIDTNCIEYLLTSSAPTEAMLSPVHYDGTEVDLDTGFAEYCNPKLLQAEYTQVEFVNAAFWMIPIHIIKKIGLFSPIFYHYGEDKDFGNRLKFHQIPIFVINKAKAYHDRHNRTSSLAINYKGEFVYHLTEFCNINYGWSEAFAQSILACYKKGFEYLIKGNLDATMNYLEIGSKLWNKISEVKETRKKNKQTGSYFNS